MSAVFVILLILAFAWVISMSLRKDEYWLWNMAKPYWRVRYKDNRETRLLGYREAKSLAETFDGVFYYDLKAERSCEHE